MVLRPKELQGGAGHNFHRCQFLIRLLEEPGRAARRSYSCWRVPAHLQDLPWQQLLGKRAWQLGEQLVVQTNSHIASVLAKLEEPRYIHCYSITTTLASSSSGPAGGGPSISSHVLDLGCSSPMSTSSSEGGSNMSTGSAGGELAGGLLFELPRLGLEFELRQGVLASRQYSGFTLGRQQQLVWQPEAAGGSGAAAPHLHYTLPGFSQYLVLEKLQPAAAAAAGAPTAQQQSRAAAATLVLVPAGAVLPPWNSGAAGVVRVQVDGACGTRVQVRWFCRCQCPALPSHHVIACSQASIQRVFSPP